ncbi:ABC transporter substrate-binding protein [Pontibacter vulgaris]|uniref:ABC transporter substrate-binding protein n=1 Tax=Pontibacter vulgaris TaxID=2905679 RepID=UPI001FA7BF7D|nr:helical backbone metal receptor [Pontibacter vulgaris]
MKQNHTLYFRLNRLFYTCLLLLLLACNGKKQEPATGQVIVFRDDLGRELKLQHQPKRVMAFSPAMTEMLFAICDTATIIARTPQCDYPTQVVTKPIVSNYPVDYEQVLALKPDLIFSSEGIVPMEVVEKLKELGVPVYIQKYRTVEDVFKGMEAIGKIMGREQQANHLADSLRQQVKQLEQRHKGQARPQQVLAITWTDPIYVYGQNTILTDKLHILGAQNAVQEVFDQPYPALTREYILKLNPNVLLGGSPEKLEQTFFSQYPELRKIKAYQNHRIYAVTGNLMERPGPRVVESILELERLLYP